jgi:hypothetical protein
MLNIKDAHVGLQENYNWVFYIGLECPRYNNNDENNNNKED